MSVTQRVQRVLRALPSEVTPVNLEELRRVKQLLVELESKADMLRCAAPGIALPLLPHQRPSSCTSVDELYIAGACMFFYDCDLRSLFAGKHAAWLLPAVVIINEILYKRHHDLNHPVFTIGGGKVCRDMLEAILCPSDV